MASYTVTHKQLTDNYAVLQLLTEAEIEVGASVVITDVNATFNGTFTVYALPQYAFIGVDEEGDLLYNPLISIPNQVLYPKTADDVGRSAATGTLSLTQVCSWVTAAQVMTYLGVTITDPSDDYTLLTQATSAGCQFVLSQETRGRVCGLAHDFTWRRCHARDFDVLRRSMAH
jgi:hypothetical protein